MAECLTDVKIEETKQKIFFLYFVRERKATQSYQKSFTLSLKKLKNFQRIHVQQRTFELTKLFSFGTLQTTSKCFPAMKILHRSAQEKRQRVLACSPLRNKLRIPCGRLLQFFKRTWARDTVAKRPNMPVCNLYILHSDLSDVPVLNRLVVECWNRVDRAALQGGASADPDGGVVLVPGCGRTPHHQQRPHRNHDRAQNLPERMFTDRLNNDSLCRQAVDELLSDCGFAVH